MVQTPHAVTPLSAVLRESRWRKSPDILTSWTCAFWFAPPVDGLMILSHILTETCAKKALKDGRADFQNNDVTSCTVAALTWWALIGCTSAGVSPVSYATAEKAKAVTRLQVQLNVLRVKERKRCKHNIYAHNRPTQWRAKHLGCFPQQCVKDVNSPTEFCMQGGLILSQDALAV